ncbi:MAG: hypothetical protein J6J33_02435 [Clostridia bacterium]|nr:hypothetical protein [Clostridia bacterium]
MSKEKSIIEILQDLQLWIEENCFADETIAVIISKIQFEIGKQRKSLRRK